MPLQTDFVLYVLMRTDMDSMTPGKAMAQACHAGNQFQKHFGKIDSYKSWASQADGFGTTIVLDAYSDRAIRAVLDRALFLGLPCGMVQDSTYPVDDGTVTHRFPVDTCGYVFIDRCRNDERAVVLDMTLLTRPFAPR